MKKLLMSGVIASIVFFAGPGPVVAQDDGMLVIPVELYACTYNDRKGPDDLDRWAVQWTAWADRNDIDDYAAWTLTPYYYGAGANSDFDVIWMGAGKDAVALGKRQETWLATNDGLADELAEIVDCGGHTNFASINFKPPPAGATPADSILTFSDCTYADGATFAALSAATAEWSQYLGAAGSKGGSWHWYPQYGGGGEDFDFKWLRAYENLADLGADYEILGNGRGFVTRGRLLGHLTSCDSARVYRAKSRRFVQLR